MLLPLPVLLIIFVDIIAVDGGSFVFDEAVFCNQTKVEQRLDLVAPAEICLFANNGMHRHRNRKRNRCQVHSWILNDGSAIIRNVIVSVYDLALCDVDSGQQQLQGPFALWKLLRQMLICRNSPTADRILCITQY